MSRSPIVFVVATLAAWSIAAVAQQAQAPRPTGTGFVSGQVVDMDTGQGVSGAQVMLMATRTTPSAPGGQVSNTPWTVTADSQGRFYFAGLPAGPAVLQTSQPGYTNGQAVRQIELSDATRVTDVRLTLRRMGSLGGRVTDDTGAPVVGIEVVMLRRAAGQGRPATLLPAYRTRTDDRGEYRLAGITPAEYLVCACLRDPIPFDAHLLTTLATRPLDLLGAAGRATVAGGDAVRLDPGLKTLPVTFHPGVTQASLAERVGITGGEDKTNVDIVMTVVPARRVSGRIVGATSSVTANFLRLRMVGDLPEAASITQIVPMLVQPDGRFDFANVPPGDYVLDVTFRPGVRGGGPTGAALGFIGGRGAAMQPPPPTPARAGGPPDPATMPLWAQEPIAVGGSDVTGLVVQLHRSLTVSGRVVFSGNAPQPDAQLWQRPNVNVNLISLEMGPQIRSFTSPLDATGRFYLTGVLPGRYVLGANIPVPPFSNVSSIVASGQDLTETIIDISSADMSDVIVTVTDTPLASLTARVALGANEPGGSVWVRVFPTDRRTWAAPFAASRRFRSIHVEPDGTARTSALPAGEYFILVSPTNDPEWMEQAVLEQLARTADRIRVNPGDTLVTEVRR